MLDLIGKIITGLLLFILTWLLLWIVASIFMEIPTDATQRIGAVLDKVDWLIAAGITVWYLIKSTETWVD
jgi:hypothetical protein